MSGALVLHLGATPLLVAQRHVQEEPASIATHLHLEALTAQRGLKLTDVGQVVLGIGDQLGVNVNDDSPVTRSMRQRQLSLLRSAITKFVTSYRADELVGLGCPQIHSHALLASFLHRLQ